MTVLRIYRTAGRFAAPSLRRMVARRIARGKEVPERAAERFGVASLPRPEGRLIWFHAASVGETLSLLPVISAIAGRTEILLTTGTVTSAKLAAARLPAYGRHQFVPLDVPDWVTAFLDHWRPDAAVFVESELWPGMLTECDARGIPRLLVNARMSARSAANWRRVKNFAKRVVEPFRYIHAQSVGDAANLRGLGMEDILEWGNLKFFAAKLPVDEAALAAFLAQITGPVFLAASTHAGEEALVGQAHAALLADFPRLVTVIVPRHPERGAEVASLFSAPRRSLGEAPMAGRIYVADTLGELGLFFRAAEFAFVGNSLVGFGGHNVVEPALLGRPVIAGPHLENFAEAAARLAEVGALARVVDADGLARAAKTWLEDPAGAKRLGEAAAAAFAPSENLPGRLADLILGCAL